MSKIARTVGERIRQIRKSKGLSQEKVALKAGITTSYMGQVERGEKSPTVDSLEKISYALNVPISELFDFDSTKVQQEYSISEKIAFHLHGISLKEQEAVYQLVKQVLEFRK